MLKDYPMIFDSTTIPFYPSSFSRADNKVSVVNQTEDGHDDVELIRAEKTTLDFTFQCSDFWAAKFRVFRRQPSISVQIYDIVTKAYDTKTMRIEDYTESLVENSDKNTESMGLYSITFTLEEF